LEALAMPIVPPSTDAFFRFEAANDEAANDLRRSYAGAAPGIDLAFEAQPLHQLIYVSSSRANWSAAELDRLLARARVHNGARGITGMLLYVSGSFIQALEGPAAVIAPLMERVRADKRHWHVQRVVDRKVTMRDFTDWSMGFRHCRPADLAAAGALDLVHEDGIAKALVGRDGLAIGLMRRFCAQSR
jgi:FAD-dependent sensor of blue light